MDVEISPHARAEMDRRGLDDGIIRAVLENPEQVVPTYGGRLVYQSRVELADGHVYLIRAIVDERSHPAVLVTAYRTTQIAKYWIAR